MVTADFEFPLPGKEPHRKLGWMVRESLQEDAAHLTATIHGDGLTVAQWRVMRGAYVRDPQDELFFPKQKARTIQLERRFKVYTMRIANWGEPLQSYGSVTLENIGNNPYVGLFVGSHHADVIEEARIWYVRVDRLVPANFNFGAADTLVSRLEVLDVTNGNRKIVYESNQRFEAPNYLPGGNTLLINSKGSLWTIPVTGGELTKFNTGFADRNNNDHVISFDGKMVGISHHRSGMFGVGSTVMWYRYQVEHVTVAGPFRRAVEGARTSFAQQSCAMKVERSHLDEYVLSHHNAGMSDDPGFESFGRGGRSVACCVLALVPVEPGGIVAVPAADCAAHFVGDQFHSMNS